jgi:hypothetical protein
MNKMSSDMKVQSESTSIQSKTIYQLSAGSAETVAIGNLNNPQEIVEVSPTTVQLLNTYNVK